MSSKALAVPHFLRKEGPVQPQALIVKVENWAMKKLWFHFRELLCNECGEDGLGQICVFQCGEVLEEGFYTAPGL